jgi:hypothetical protein
MGDRYPEGRHWWARVSTAAGDRILMGLCAAIWLVLLGMSVAAVVALVDLGTGFHKSARNSHTSSVLYAIIVVSALVILVAISVLLRARRTTPTVPGARPSGAPARGVSGRLARPEGYPPARTTTEQVRTERLATLRPLSNEEVDRIWLRGAAALMATMGAALVAVATATYLMAIGHDGAAWAGYVIAGLVTLIMPAILWRGVQWLGRTLTTDQPSS